MALYELDGIAPALPDDGDCWIAPTAAVIGNVTLEKGASVWWGAVIRGDNEPIVIGAGSNIQDNCTLHTDPGFPLTVGPGCIIGHNVMLHGCTIGRNALIGIAATVLNGATIGAQAIIGASSLVPEGKDIPARSLAMGVPAKVAREIDDDVAASLAEQAERYVKNAARFRAGLKAL